MLRIRPARLTDPELTHVLLCTFSNRTLAADGDVTGQCWFNAADHTKVFPFNWLWYDIELYNAGMAAITDMFPFSGRTAELQLILTDINGLHLNYAGGISYSAGGAPLSNGGLQGLALGFVPSPPFILPLFDPTQVVSFEMKLSLNLGTPDPMHNFAPSFSMTLMDPSFLILTTGAGYPPAV